jgi:hypothetical protein
MKNRILKTITAAWYLLWFGVFLFAIPQPTFRAVTNGKEFRIERRVISPWHHVICGERASTIEEARERVLKLTAEDKRIDAVNDNTWVKIQ